MEIDIRNRYRRDYTREIIGNRQPEATIESTAPTTIKTIREKSLNSRQPARRRLLIIVVWVLTICAVGSLALWHRPTKTAASPSPVPVSVASSVNFLVYYPDPAKLPAGYQLNRNSFVVPVKNGVNYTISYGNAKKIVFSVQGKPSDNDLQTFNSSYIPLRVDYQTPIGQAEIGAYHGQTLVSLPVTDGPWVILTAPPDINQPQLKQILQAMRR